jgi:hypothetical protein
MMSSDQLRRWSGLASIVGGLCLALFALLHPPRDITLASGSFWVIEHQLGVAAFVLMPFGLTGIYTRQADKIGLQGFIGFVLAFSGSTLYMGGIFLDAYIFPVIVGETPELVEGILQAEVSGPPAVGLGLASVLFSLGFLILGFSTAQAKVLPRWGGIMLLVGGAIFGPGPIFPKLIQTLAAVALGLGFVWSGYTLWSEQKQGL